MLALSAWSIGALAVVAFMVGATLVAVAFGRASSRADDEADRLVAEHRKAQLQEAEAAGDRAERSAAETQESAVGNRDGDDDTELVASS